MKQAVLRTIPLLLGAALVIGCTTSQAEDDDTEGVGGRTGGSGGDIAEGGAAGEAPSVAGSGGQPATAGQAGSAPTGGSGAEGGAESQAGAGGVEQAGSGGATAGAGGAAGSAGTGTLPTFTFSGTIGVNDRMFIDSDTANTDNPFYSNDSPAESQPIGNPSSVGGYLGPVEGGNDTVDFYEVQLAAQQAVTVYIGTSQSGGQLPNFDLVLYDTGGSPVLFSAGTGAVEMVVAETSGTYFIAVDTPDAETGTYTMTVGQDTTSSLLAAVAREQMSPLHPMEEGTALVRLRDSGRRMSDSERRQQLGISRLGRRHPRLGHQKATLHLPAALGRSGSALDRTRATVRAIQRLRRSRHVEIAEPNYYRYPMVAAPDDPHYSKQWHYGQINLLDAWDHNTGGDYTGGVYPDGTYSDHNSVIVAVLDTGVKLSHPDLAGQLIDGYDMVSSPSVGADGESIAGRDDDRDANPDDPGDGATMSDSSWHGTHCAGTVAAVTDNGEGCAGVAPGAKIMPIRVLGRGGGRSEDVLEGILYAAGLENDSGEVPPRRADIISMSLGGPGRSLLMEDAVAQARAAGVIVIAAAGNSNMDATIYSPAGEPGVVTVSAVDREKEKTSYSNYGSVVDVAAPGGVSFDQNFDGLPDNVYSLVWANEGQTLYKGLQGTSMACPHVSGIAALMKAAYPELTPQQFDQFIGGTFAGAEPITEDIGDEGQDDEYGHGLINANLAVLAALEAAGSTPVVEGPVVSLSVQSLDFGFSDTALPLSIENAGTGDLTFDSWSASEPWVVDILPGPPLAGPQFVYIDEAARTTLDEGVHTATVTIETNGGTAEVAVRLEVGDWDVEGGDIGVVYVVVWDVEADDVYETVATSISDDFAFSLADVPAGRYRVYAGTDIDNNDFIDDDGEAFGAYPVLNDTELVDLTQEEHVDPTSLNFDLQFLFNLQSAVLRAGQSPVPASPAGGIRRTRAR